MIHREKLVFSMISARSAGPRFECQLSLQKCLSAETFSPWRFPKRRLLWCKFLKHAGCSESVSADGRQAKTLIPSGFVSLEIELLGFNMRDETDNAASLSEMICHYLWNCPPPELARCNCGDLAAMLRMHPVVLSRRFSREYGRPLVAVLREIKVVRAVGMLHYGKVASVDEAMATVGYRDRKYFNALVFKMFGKKLAEF